MVIDTCIHVWRSLGRRNCWNLGECCDYHSEVLRDLFNRKMKIKEDLLLMLKSLFPAGHCDGDVFVAGKFRFLLNQDSCGSWMANCSSNRNFEFFAQKAKTSNIESFAVANLGMPASIAYKELARRSNISLSYEKRYIYSFKPGYFLVRSFNNLCFNEYPHEKNPLEVHRAQLKRKYPYTNPDGSIHHYIFDFELPEGKIEKLPLTLWEATDGDRIFDWLHPVRPYPLYNHPNFYQKNSAILVCKDESQVDYIRDNHPKVSDVVSLTTWSGGMYFAIDDSDWGAIADRQVIIVVVPCRDGYKKANKLYTRLKKAGFKEVNFLMPWYGHNVKTEDKDALVLQRELTDAFDRDLLEAILIKGEVADPPDFFQDANTRFGLKFTEFHGRSYDLNELLAMKLPEPIAVLCPIIMAGDKVMIFAHRGSGKTWLICFIVCAIGSGRPIFDGMYYAPNPLRILVFDGEMRLKKLQERYDFICKSMNIPAHLRSNIRIRASSIEGKQIKLETPEERAPFKDDIEWADVIVIDSVCFLFPNAMSGNIEGADGFNDFLNSCSLQGKTVIAVDHTGKSKKSSFGTSAKEFGLDVVIKLDKPKESKDDFKLSFTKGRNLGANDKKDVKFSLIVDNDAGVAELNLLSEYDDEDDFEKEEPLDGVEDGFSGSVHDDAYTRQSLDDDNQEDSLKHDRLDFKIIAALKENPGLSARALAKIVGTSKSTAQARRKQLEDTGRVVPKPSRKVSVS